MATLTIEGRKVAIDDGFLKLSPDEQSKTVDEIAQSLKLQPGAAPTEPAEHGAEHAAIDPTDPRFTPERGAAVKALEGVPLLGAYVPNAGAAISATANPITGVGSKGETWWDRYKANLAQEKAFSHQTEEEHPIMSAAAGGIGGTLALGGVGGAFPAAARAMGMTGKLLPAMRNAALSGTAIGAADAAARGDNVSTGAITGALTGAGGVVAGKALGAGWDALQRGIRPKVPPVPARTIDVNGEPVPVSEGVALQNPAMQSEEEAIRRGSRGDEAQTAAQAHDALRQAGMHKVAAKISADLDHSGASPGTTAQGAAEQVAAELAQKETERAAAQAARVTAADREGASIKTDLNPKKPENPLTDVPGLVGSDAAATAGTISNLPIADTPMAAAEAVSQGVREAAARAAAARTAAYDAMRAIPGEFQPAAFSRIGNSIRAKLNTGSDPVKVTEQLTPRAAQALDDLDMNVGQLRFENLAEQGSNVIGPDGRPVPRPITGETIDEARKRLVSMQRDASAAAAKPGGDASDARAMRRILAAFEDHVQQAVNAGAFSGDGKALIAAQKNARSLHSDLKKTFGPQNPQDTTGKAIEAIVGRYPGQQAEVDKIASLMYGSQSNPGGGATIKLADRLKSILGADSPEYAAYRQGLLAHVTEHPVGTAPWTHGEVADRIDRFTKGISGAPLAQKAFSPAELKRLNAHSKNLRTLDAPAAQNQVDKILHSWSGRDSGLPATPADVIKYLNSANSPKAISVHLVKRLKSDLSPKSFNAIRQGQFRSLIEPPEGVTDWGERRIANNLAKFINGDGQTLAKELFTERELKAMDSMRKAYEMMAPLPGTTNPSGTAHMGARLLQGARHTLLPLLGFSHGGVAGAGAAIALDRAATKVGARMNANKAVRRFYGDQPKASSVPRDLPQRFGALLPGAVLPSIEQ